MSHFNTKILQYRAKPRPILTLVLDDNTEISMADKPVFGTPVTISEKTKSFIGKVLMPGVVIGWVNYVDVSKFACITQDNHYLQAEEFIYTENNQIILAKALKILSIDEFMHESKQILTFSVS